MKPVIIFPLMFLLLVNCNSPGTSGIFAKQSPHDAYAEKIRKAGLEKTALARRWLAVAHKAVDSPLSVHLPYSETGYFAAEDPGAAGIRFYARRGEKLHIRIRRNPTATTALYLDLWEWPGTAGAEPKPVLSADTSTANVDFEVGREGAYILRLQPELLTSMDYTLSISTGPTLAFPVSPGVKSNIGSFWGAGRDAGDRRHEGIDIFAPRGTAVVAAADGVITRVNENRLGGRVIFMTPDGRPYTLYYAHLQMQIARQGQQVRTGDTIGLVGNTGNAVTTDPHLHFGIYTYIGAIDPLPFVDPVIKTPAPVTAPKDWLGKRARNTTPVKLLLQPATQAPARSTLTPNTLLKLYAATGNWYRVSLPNGQQGFVAASSLTVARSPLARSTIKTAQPLLDQPDQGAAKKSTVAAGNMAEILGRYGHFYFVSVKNATGWVSTNGFRQAF